MQSYKLTPFATSNELPHLLELMAHFHSPIVAHFIKFKFIVDANIVLKDIRWLMISANSENAKTSLLELLEISAIQCFAPTFIDEELRKNIRLHAVRYQYDEEKALGLWERFKSQLVLVDSGGPEQEGSNFRDPKDVPYIRLQQLENASIITEDKDIEAMGGKVADSKVIIDLRNYARNSAIKFKVILVGGLVVWIPFAVVSKTMTRIYTLLESKLKEFPQWAWLLLGGASVLLFIHPKSRTAILSFIDNLTNGAINVAQIYKGLGGYLLNELYESHSEIGRLSCNIESKLNIMK